MSTNTENPNTRYSGSITRRVPPLVQNSKQYPNDFSTLERSWAFMVVKSNDPSFLKPEQLEALLVTHKLLHGYWDKTDGYPHALLTVLIPQVNGANNTAQIECDSLPEISPPSLDVGKKGSRPMDGAKGPTPPEFDPFDLL